MSMEAMSIRTNLKKMRSERLNLRHKLIKEKYVMFCSTFCLTRNVNLSM